MKATEQYFFVVQFIDRLFKVVLTSECVNKILKQAKAKGN